MRRYLKDSLLARHILAIFVASVLFLSHGCARKSEEPNVTNETVIQLMRQAAASGIEGKKLEEAGDYNGTLSKYEDSVRFADSYFDAYQRIGTPFESRPPVAYWLAGRSHFETARMMMQLKRQTEQINLHLTQARQALSDALKLDHLAAQRAGSRYTDDTWKFFNFRAEINLMLGDLPNARQDYAIVANNLNQGFRPAVDALAYIDYLEGLNQRATTPNGLKAPEKSSSKVTNRELVSLAFDFLKLIAREYQGEIALAQKVTDIAMR